MLSGPLFFPLPSSPALAPPLKGTALRCSKRRVLLLGLCECGNTTGCGRFFLEERGARGGGNLLQDGNWWPLAGYLRPDRTAKALRYCSCSGVTDLRAEAGIPRKSKTSESGSPKGSELASSTKKGDFPSCSRPRCRARSDAPGSSKCTASSGFQPPPHCCHV